MSPKEVQITKLSYIDRTDLSELKGKLMERSRKNRGHNECLTQAMINSLPTLDAYLMFEDAITEFLIGPNTRELIALAISETNSCQYCLAIHIEKATTLGMSPEIVFEARQGHCSNRKADLAIKFALEVRKKNGHIGDSKRHEMLERGFTEGGISEIIALVAFYTFETLYCSVFAISAKYAHPDLLSKQD